VLDPVVELDFAEGEILVCRTTDPSWGSYFLLAASVVIEIGGPMGHGATVARELGIPCVISVRDVTRRLRTGDHIKINGATGLVHSHPSQPPITSPGQESRNQGETG